MAFSVNSNYGIEYAPYYLKILPAVEGLPKQETLPYMKNPDLYSFESSLEFLASNVKVERLAIDGTCGVGKSSLLYNMDLPVLKISHYINDESRNYDPISSINYLMASCAMIDGSTNCVFDRSPMSNLVWLLIPQFYNNYHLTKDMTEFGLLNVIMDQSYIKSAINYLKKKDYNVLVIINTNLEDACKNLEEREGSYTDIWTANWPFYIHVQNVVYSYLAQMLGYVCWDLNELKSLAAIYNKSTTELYEGLRNSIEQDFHFDTVLPSITARDSYVLPQEIAIKRNILDN